MSLKALHIVFVTASVLLAFGFAVWSVLAYREDGLPSHLAYAAGSFVAGIALVVYGKVILRKLRHISYL